MPAAVVNAQRNAELLQPLQLMGWLCSELCSGASIQTPVAWGINKRNWKCVHIHHDISWKHGGMALVTGVLEWKVIGS